MKKIIPFFLLLSVLIFSFPVHAFSNDDINITSNDTVASTNETTVSNSVTDIPTNESEILIEETTVSNDVSDKSFVKPKEQSIIIKNKNKTVEVGSSAYRIKYKLVNFKSKEVSFYSSDKKVASVSKDGIVTGRKKGKVTITVKAKDISSSFDIDVVSECLSLNADSAQISRDYKNVKKYNFGKTNLNRPLEAYIITPKNGKFKKTYVMTFAIHGCEDSYPRDGRVLTKEGNHLIKYYADHPSKLKGFRLVIVPCLNPDGAIAGRSNSSSGFGRCNSKHIDINRDFKSGKFRSNEAKAMVKLLNKYKPDVYTDFHGWLNFTMGSGSIGSYFNKSLSLAGQKVNQYGYTNGYLVGYVRHKYQCPCALVEHRSPGSVNYKKTYRAINKILENY